MQPATNPASPATAPTVAAPSPGQWALALRRLRHDRVAIASGLVMVLYLLVVLLSASGLLADDWNREAAVHYAPPTFMASPAATGQAASVSAGTTPATGATPAASSPAGNTSQPLPDNPRDPLADDLRALRLERGDILPQAAARGDAAPPVIDVKDPLYDVLSKLPSWKDPAATTTGDGPGTGLVIDIADPLADVLAGLPVKPVFTSPGPAGTRRTVVSAGDQPTPRLESLPLGADKWGRDVLKKAIKGTETSFVVGLLAALVATALGSVFGALAGYFGGRMDAFFNWLYSVFTSVPYLLLILAVAAVLQKKGIGTIVFILGLTGWTGVFRLIRGEYIKHRVREYVRAAEAIGASHTARMIRHILPNVSHVMLVQLSILTVGFIKSEVILSFLGFGVPVDSVSWGSMLNEAQNELLLGYWWQMLAASLAMAGLVTAFSLLTDSLRDALDPKLK